MNIGRWTRVFVLLPLLLTSLHPLWHFSFDRIPEFAPQTPEEVPASSWMHAAYAKASNTGTGDNFGYAVAVSGDTLVVGAYLEDSAATGVNGNSADNSAVDSGAAYVYQRINGVWTPQAYLKASNTDAGDWFGWSVAIAGDTIVVGARNEASSATTINGNQADNTAPEAGAAYVFVRSSGVWSQQAYLKSANHEAGDRFGWSIGISGDTIVVGAYTEDSAAAGVNGDGSNNAATSAGAAYVFVRTGTVWSQQAYLKASNTDASDWFGWTVAIAGDTVAVAAPGEASAATGINGNQANNSAPSAGAAYVFTRSGTNWSQQAYLKASNTEAEDLYGWATAIDADTVVIGALREDSSATGVNGDGSNNAAISSGAAYVYFRSGAAWSQQAYLKASNPDQDDNFGSSVAVWGDRVLIGAPFEASSATGINGDPTNNTASAAGAVYGFARTPSLGTWLPQAYIKATNTGANDRFGWAVTISGEAAAVGARGEDSQATGINGDQTNNAAPLAGAVYLLDGVLPIFLPLARRP